MADVKKYDIIMMAIFRWDGPYSSTSISLAKEFSKGSRIFYINHPYSWKDYLQLPKAAHLDERKADLRKGQVRYEKDEKLSDNFTSVIPPLTVPINTVPKGGFYNWLAKNNNAKVVYTIRQVIKDFDIKEYIFVNCFDPFYATTLPEDIKPTLHIYQSVDDISQSDYIARHGVYLENQAIQKADLTLTTSSELFRIKSAFTKQIHILNNAADITGFQRALTVDYDRPEELREIKTPIIGYIGNLDEIRVDYHLLKRVATEHPNKKLVLIGPINNTIYKEIGLDKMPNVVFLGKKNIDDLPAYLKYFDCAIIPFACNQLTRSIYPLKINEYLAAGKAVVSTAFSEDIRGFSDSIFLSENETEFVKNIGAAVESNTPENIAARVQVAGTNTWANRVEQFWQIVNGYLVKGSESTRTTV